MHTQNYAAIPAKTLTTESVQSQYWTVAAPGGGGANAPQIIFCPPFCPPSKKFISHWERLKATQAFCRYRKMYGL
jgi:hypothetical protein